MNKHVVVISGASGVLGQQVAKAFAGRGDSLVLLSKNQDKLTALAHDLNLPSERILTRATNLLDESAIRDSAEAASAKFGDVDTLIHLVGGWTGGKILTDARIDELKAMLDQHVWTTLHLIQAFLPAIELNSWGRVIVVSSPFATNPSAKMGIYAAAKSAQETLLLTLAEQFKGTDITANIIQVKSIDVKGEGKGTSPEEIVSAMLYLCSDQAGKVNGARLPLYD